MCNILRYWRKKMPTIQKGFWVLEGLDGAGTTTQLKNLEKTLLEKGIKVHCTCEPTKYETGKFLRQVLSGEVKVPQSTVAYLFAADRDNHLNNPEYGIISHIKAGEIVISDRYLFSSFAYQSIGFDYNRVKELNSQFPYPELVIYIDTPLEACINRIDSRGEAKEIYEKCEYQKKVQENYEKVFSSLPKGCILLRINGSGTREEIFQQIWSQLKI